MTPVLAVAYQSYLDRHSGAIQAIGSVVLVIITGYYAWQSRQTVKKAQEQVEVAQREVSTSQEQVRLQQAANETSLQVAQESVRARLASTIPVVAIEVFPAGLTPVGEPLAQKVNTPSFDNGQWTGSVDFTITNHGPGPAKVGLAEPSIGKAMFFYSSGRASERKTKVLGVGETVSAEWRHRSSGTLWRKWSAILEVRFTSQAVVVTGVDDEHVWRADFKFVEEDMSVFVQECKFYGPEVATQDRHLPAGL